MHIRAVVPNFPPYSLVGSWLTTAEFLEHMVERGHRVSVYPYMTRTPHYTYRGMWVTSHMREILAEAAGGTVEERTDVVVGHVGDDGSARLVAQKLHVPLVYMVHGGDTAEIRRKLGHCNLAVFNSAALRDEIDSPVRSIVAHPPFDPAAYTTTPGQRVTLINLSLAKGAELFWELTDRLQHIPFLAVRGAYGPQVLWGGHRNVLLQRTTVNMRDEVYGRTRILLMPSVAESWGRVGLEAACSGIPTIAHPHPGVVEALGDTAIYVDRGDVDGWAEAIEVLYGDDVWASASAAAKARSACIRRDDQLDRFAGALEEVAACAQCS